MAHDMLNVAKYRLVKKTIFSIYFPPHPSGVLPPSFFLFVRTHKIDYRVVNRSSSMCCWKISHIGGLVGLCSIFLCLLFCCIERENKLTFWNFNEIVSLLQRFWTLLHTSWRRNFVYSTKNEKMASSVREKFFWYWCSYKYKICEQECFVEILRRIVFLLTLCTSLWTVAHFSIHG